MKGNPIVWLIVQLAVIVWAIYQLAAPGEAQAPAVIVMEVVALIGVSLGLVATVIRVASRK